MKKVILASSSKYRKELLTRLGIEFSCISPDINEEQYKDMITDPSELAHSLSKIKAEAILSKNPDAIVIGSDQVAHIEGEILGKAGSIENARKQLYKLNGKTHKLITAVTICSNNQSESFVNETTLTMKNLTQEQINFYLTVDNPIDCAGSYKLEQYGIGLFSEIKSEDHTAIVGLPLLMTGQILEKFGVLVFSKL